MKWFDKILSLANPRGGLSLTAMGWIAAGTLALDQAGKLAAVAWLEGERPLILIPNLLNLAFATNTGAAFSILSGRTLLLTMISLIVIVGIAIWAVRLAPEERGLRLELGLILGGAIGNQIDRLRLGHVIDFIDAHWFWKAHWPTFNIADSAICVGMALLALAMFRPASKPQPAVRPDAR